MGGLTTLASTAIQALGAANAVIGTINGYEDRSGQRAYQQARQQAEASMRNAAEQTALQKEQIRLTAQAAETERRSALRRAMARQRAQYGASGVNAADSGSAQAVLLGLFNESEQERTQREALDALRANAADQSYANNVRINTLQLTQMRERDKLRNIGATLDAAKTAGTVLF
ncbi:MAG: transporter [Micavibrio aeruginosavorus]|uniref:Transporter n=1 Tax=Micavibrio aeruginosavorus TaxID=349221 RepID=A0A2W5A7A3_9BACT|nr:MAG: transporter [Micavibrio aeruginosavorus]